ncbi:DUF1996 domain-containing protein [Rugosimonospora africana]|uniref:DUF1996 domain-containing protein n=1 Tax=Rugosimonospora africana TaxID=556532 RepID=A0A8J3R450_9ACTN|nr:DUF1996 domain-containing protein [Rugosimonospora africana]GIH19716.1 hypothetical protein Raf01_78880 [Rugosimonospora africana]
MTIRSTMPRFRPRSRYLTIAGVLIALAGGVAVAGPAVAADDPPRVPYHEMHADCTVNHTLSDDPIVFPGLPGASHNHSFVGSPTTNANSTPQSLVGGATSCQDSLDASGYWFPTLLQRGVPLQPDQPTVYYKSGVTDYRTVKPFPAGFKLLVGDAHTPDVAHFEGNWQCTGYRGSDIPASCPAGSSLQVRLTAPSCWDGVHLDSTDHKSHMAWPVNGSCPVDHPVPLPMLEIKLPYPLRNGDTGGLAYSSGPSYTFHYDFMNGWDPARQAYLVSYCINGGRQCNGFGVDPKKP